MDINKLGYLMVETGACIRAIPLLKRGIHEVHHANQFPNGRIVFLPDFKREMLVVESVPKHAGEFLIEAGCGTDAMVRFSGKKYFKTLEEAANALSEKLEEEKTKWKML